VRNRRLLAAAVLVPLLLTGCQVAAPGSDAGGPLRVVAAESMWGSLATQLGGTQVEVVSLISSPDVDPHSYEPTAVDARDVAVAQVLITNGLGYDTWASKLASADPSAGRRNIDVGTLVGLGVGANPHRWYSPTDVVRVADAITAAYISADPSAAAEFRALHDRLLGPGFATYRSMIADIRSRYSGVTVGASESIFAPLSAALGLRLITPPSFLRAISEGTDPTAADLLTISEQISGHRIAVYVENVQNRTPDVARQAEAAAAAGIPVVTITETLAPVSVTFQQWQTEQLGRLAAALKEALHR